MRGAGAALVLLAAGLAGCASARPAAPEGYTLGEVRPGSAPLRGELVYPLAAFEHRFLVDGRGPTVVRSARPTDRFDAAWVLDEDGVNEDYVLDEDGVVALTVTISRSEKTVTRFSPPLVLCWPELEPGEPREAEAEMKVFELQRPRRLKESGTAHRSIVYAGDQPITAPDGTETLAHRVEVEFTADLRLAKVKRHDVLLVTEDGPQVIQTRQEITVLGVLPSMTERTLVRE